MPVAQIGGRAIRIQGTVQGVGFRPWVYRMARLAGVTGRVWNDAAGVAIDAFGEPQDLDRFISLLQTPPAAARVDAFDVADIAGGDVDRGAFSIGESDAAGAPRVSIPPDLAICDECLAEMFDPANRRFRYAFTNCTNCGPRLTIATGIPYDRSSTTMTAFEMCEACRREYDDPSNRRFHAQPNACPACGPRLTLCAPDGSVIHVDDVVASAAQLLRDGMIVAVKGLGGFHLACSAASDTAVRRLRMRKHREEKPFAVMVATLAAAERLVEIDAVARRLLTSAERPIVLAPKRRESAVAESVAPRNQLLGVMLAYTPLHHLLLAEAGGPLVMTSANLSDEPIASGNAEALERLRDIADVFVLHDRDIQTRCDDSVVTTIAGSPVVLRRSRGYVPRGIALRQAVRPTLACGALLKNTFCLAAGHHAWLGPHIGDLENLETFTSYRDAIDRMEQFLEIEPEIAAHDLHPDYMSTLYAQARTDVTAVAVQHHHAHVVAAMAEHAVDGPVIGVAYDGTGYGTDGTVWGGEILVTTPQAFTRAGSFRPLRLVGADRAIRDPWRIALAFALDAFDGALPPPVRSLFDHIPHNEFDQVVKAIDIRLPAPMARGVGRYFDAFGALFLRRRRAAFEGQLALEWNQVAAPVSRGYRYAIARIGEFDEIDLRPTLREAVCDLSAGLSVASISGAFHNTIAVATAQAVRAAAKRYGAMPVVGTGGCFQNARLAEAITSVLAPEFDVLLHRDVPPGDGGIALGQVVAANAILERE